MFFRKHPPPTPWKLEKEQHTKSKDTHFTILFNPFLKYTLFLFSTLSAWYLVLLFWFPPITSDKTSTSKNSTNPTKPLVRTCNGAVSVYMYELPAEFNMRLIEDCHHLNVYTDMCPHVANRGLGQPLSDMSSATTRRSWFATHQFIAEMIFHARVNNHPCRTRDPDEANLFYVPFYGGLHASSMFREPNLTARDALAVGLIEYLQTQPWWGKNNGKDHFIALGRTAWDFMRNSISGPDFGANKLLDLPAVQNMSVLTVERHPWRGPKYHQQGIPYPSYFHPYTSSEMLMWQNKMRQSNRLHLFSFTGAPRKGLEKAAIRDEIIRQCNESTRCQLVNCRGIGTNKCFRPSEVVKVMSQSEFCLQAPGDSFTRRSTFDSILAGCVPVFFTPHTAYTQYTWYLPAEADAYSVFIDEKGNGSKRIEEELLKIPREEVKRMRERVIDLIPRLTYAHPNATEVGFEDAVDVALAALHKYVKLRLS